MTLGDHNRCGKVLDVTGNGDVADGDDNCPLDANADQPVISVWF